MPKGYWIVSLDVTDPEQYANYVKLVRPYLAERGARFLTRGGAYEAVEGTSHSRNIVIEFPSYQAAVDAYRSPEYQAMVAIRKTASQGNFIIAEGLEG